MLLCLLKCSSLIFPLLKFPVNHFITVWDNETEFHFPHHKVSTTPWIWTLFTPKETLPNHASWQRQKAVHVGVLQPCCLRDKQKAPLNKTALALTTQLLEPQYGQILIRHNYANSCICIQHLEESYREPSRSLLDVTQPEREPQCFPQKIKLTDWWDSRLSQPGEEGKKQRLV